MDEKSLEQLQSQPRNDKTILVVDDDPAICEMMNSLLGRERIQVISTVRSQEALTYLIKGSQVVIDLLITDLQMPAYGGFSIIKDLQSPKYNQVPILVVTGRNLDHQAVALIKMESNVIDVIKKPISTRDFIVRVREILGMTSAPESSA